MIILFAIAVFLFFYVVFNYLPKLVPARHIKKGTALILEGKYEEGLVYFEKGAMSKNIKPYTKIRYAFLELKYGELKKAKKVISLIINDAFIDKKMKYEAKAIWALICFKEGDIEQAREVCDMLVKNYKTTDVYCTLGYIYNLTASPEEAVAFNLEAYGHNPDKAVIVDNLAQAYYLNGELPKANELYEKMMKDYSASGEEKNGEKKPPEKNNKQIPAFPEAYYNYALVLKAMGNKDKATEMLREALKKEFHNLTTVSRETVEKELKILEGNEN